MRKVVYTRYGSVENMKILEVPKPRMTSDMILVKVKAVAVNPLDWKIRNGEMRLITGFKFPKGICIDFAGEVEEVGSAIKDFAIGDAVFGAMNALKGGALAEYVAVQAKQICRKPTNISFAEAAAMPVAGAAALTVFDKVAPISAGMEVLINGATGGVGAFAIQVAKKYGALVTSVAGSHGIALARKLGSDFVLDYTKNDIRKSGKLYDVVVDFSMKMPFSSARFIMKPRSVYVNAVPGPGALFSGFLNNIISSKKHYFLMSSPSKNYLENLTQMALNGLNIHVGKTYAFADYKTAFLELPKGGLLGKAVIVLENTL